MPIDSAGIGEALQRSAASFYAANTDLSKSIALITATNSVVQDPDSVGTMWKTVSMRIRGAVTELEEAGLETDGIVESTSTLRNMIKGMTGFDIMEDEDTFKDIYDIVVGIGEKWGELSDINQAALLEALAGKRQGNALSAALNNIDMLKEAYQIAEDSEGSALRENEKYIQSISGRMEKLTANAQALASAVIESDWIKTAVTGASNFLELLTDIIDKVGSLPVLITAITSAAMINKGGREKMFSLNEYAASNPLPIR